MAYRDNIDKLARRITDRIPAKVKKLSETDPEYECLNEILNDEQSILTVSTYLDGQYGQDGVFTSVPAILDATGVKEVVEIEMTKEEKEQFDSSCSHLQSFYKEV